MLPLGDRQKPRETQDHEISAEWFSKDCASLMLDGHDIVHVAILDRCKALVTVFNQEPDSEAIRTIEITLMDDPDEEPG
jgi:hypothetical protein